MLDELRACSSLDDVAQVLGYKVSRLAYLLYKIPDTSKYTPKVIAKKSGGFRHIEAPIGSIKRLQRVLSSVLYLCNSEVTELVGPKRLCAFGYVKNRNIVDNANMHRKKKYVFNVDIENYFGSIHIGRIMGYLQKDQNFLLHLTTAKIIAQICCKDGVLPQGAPTSPIVSHLIGTILDSRLSKFARTHGCVYSRYVDDLTFSTSRADFPSAIAVRNESDQGWKAGDGLVALIGRSGFALNLPKTRMSLYDSRQTITGLVSNSKPNVTSEYRRSTRAMCHTLFMGGSPHRKDFFVGEDGDQLPATLNAVEGRLGFQYDVDHRFDQRSSAERLKNRTSRDKTFYAFLLYKIFMANQRPLIITEGDTDKVYLECSAKALRPNDQRFVVPSAPGPVLAFNVLNRGKRLAQVMGWTGGTGPIQNALIGLKLFKNKFPVKPEAPVIILVDNDQGSKSIFSVIKENYNIEINHDDESDYFKLADGLYLIKTPHLGKRKMTFIESFLPASALAHKIGGRGFSSSNEYNKRTHFGKADMAKFVSNNRVSISFLGYALLLNRIEAALIDAGL